MPASGNVETAHVVGHGIGLVQPIYRVCERGGAHRKR